MKTQELRIGNAVNFTENNELAIVSEIDADGIKVDVGKELVWIEITSFNQILLTEEWIIRLGFKIKKHKWSDGSISNNYFWLRDYFVLIETDYISLARVFQGEQQFVSNIESVHQLQNLYFTLTSEELIFNPLKDKQHE